MSQTAWHGITIGLLFAVALQAVVLVALMRQVGRLLLRVGPARAGATEGGPKAGDELSVPGVREGYAAVVVFVAPGCGPCTALTPSLPALQRTYSKNRVKVELIAAIVEAPNGQGDELATRIGSIARTDLEREFKEWGVPGTPFGVGIDANGLVRIAGVVNNLDHLEEMVAATLEPRHARSELHRPETQAPEQVAVAVDGRED
jgi:thiol-disulfide isomerase/thioredoxin